MSTQQSFYVYEHWRLDTGLPFYVGKGTANRANRAYRNRRHGRIVSKLRRCGLDYEIRKVFTGLDEGMAFILEKSQISYWLGRGIDLANLTPGGEGSTGYKWTDEQRARLREKRSTPEVRAAMAVSARLALARPEVKAKHSAAVRAALASPEVKKNMSDGWARWREEQRISPRVLSKKSKEALAKHRANCKATMARPEVMARHSAKLKEAWSRRKSITLSAGE